MEKDAIFQKQELSYPSLQDRIKTALCYFEELYFIGGVLLQFWAPEEIEGQLHLTTTLQPFAFTKWANEKLREYRKHCVGYKLLVQDEESAGIVGRVFRNRLPEAGPYLKYYSEIEYPQRDLALSCGIISIIALPVGDEPSGQPCVGVLELLLHQHIFPLSKFFRYVLDALKKRHLRTTYMDFFHSPIIGHYGSHIQNEIKTAVEQVCNTYNLPLGITWVSSKHTCSNGSFQEELLVASPQMSSRRVVTFVDVWNTPLRVNQGLVGKVFSSGNIHFCKDVCQLSISEYPLIHLARKLGIAASFAVCLRDISTGNHEFVIDFSLSSEITYNLDIQGYFPSILATMKQHLRSFEVITGDMEIEIFTEVPTQREESDNDFTSYMAISTPTTSEGDSMQSLGTTECSMNSTCRQPVWPSRKCVNESNLFIPESSFPVNRSAQRAESESNGWGNSETASTKCLKLFGFTMSANQLDVPILNQSRRTMSLHSGEPLSEASAIYANMEMITDVELLTIKVSYEKDIIKFNLPFSSSFANLRENIVTRWCFLKEKAYAIKYLGESGQPISLATDKDLQECMARKRSKGIKLIRMLIQMDDDV